MAVQLSTLSNVANDATLVTGQVIASAEHNASRTAHETALNNYLTSLRDNENNYASGSAPADKPAGKFWWDSANLLMKYYEVGAGQLRTVANLDGTQTLTNKTLTGAGGTLTGFTSADFLGAAAIGTPAANHAGLAALTTDGFGVAKSSLYLLNEAGTRWEFGGGATKNVAGLGLDLTSSYISGTGTPGIDNTSQPVKSITIKGGSLNAIGKGLKFCVQCVNTGASGLVIQLSFAGTAFHTSTISTINGSFHELTVWYIDATHVNTDGWFTAGPSGASTRLSQAGPNAAVSSLASDQTFTVAQGATVATHTTVYQIAVYQLG